MEYDIYDPSNTVASGYWQMGHAPKTSNPTEWQAIADGINQGLPTREELLFRRAEPELEHELWGCIRQYGVFWIYRIFITGRDNFARRGRYFFVLLRMDSLDELRDPSVVRIVRYLETQTAIPLNVQELMRMLVRSPDEVNLTSQILSRPTASLSAKKLEDRFSVVPERAHYGWVIRNDENVREYMDLPSPSRRSTPPARPDHLEEEIRKMDKKITSLEQTLKNVGETTVTTSRLKSLIAQALILYALLVILLAALGMGLVSAFNRLNQVESELGTIKWRLEQMEKKQAPARGTKGGSAKLKNADISVPSDIIND